ncbi:MAG: adenine phosphoribosyltransferase [Verrucomicrobiales bacterium]|nr:adenine phosphoribosyltransferase [Verrucomicrobiales bacterium]|tara:strand:- start:8769 stop:9296 length:528 start_codon:yes stop_codon:yes gene_type:complete
MSVTAEDISNAIRDVPDFPKPGVLFKDISPVLANPGLLEGSIDLLADGFQPGDIDAVVGIDARGFIFATGVALKLNAGFVPIRKKGKLPYKTHEESYDLEYGSNTVAIHIDAVKPGDRVLLVDDLLATGGTATAAAKLLRKIHADIREIRFLIELAFLNGSERLGEFPVKSILSY